MPRILADGKPRAEILAAANLQLDKNPHNWRKLARRHIQEAVCIVRQNLLVSDDTLRRAGYNGVTVSPARRAEPWGGRGGFVRGDNLQSEFVGRPRPKRARK